MPGPCQENFLRTFTELLANSHHVGHCLTRMLHRGFKIDDWDLRILSESIQDRIGSLCFPILQSGKRPYANRDTIPAQHAHELRDMLSLVAIHHCAVTMLEGPTCPARFQHHGIATEFVNSDLH